MEDQDRPGAGPQLGALLRRLAEAAERGAAARAALLAGVERILDAPSGDASGLLQAAIAAAPALDAGVLLALGPDATARLRASTERAAGALVPLEGIAAEALRTGRTVARTGGLPGLLPDGTRAVGASPLLAGDGEALGIVLLGSRSAPELSREDQLVIRLAAERLARELERERLGRRLERGSQAATGFRDQVLAIVGHDLRNPLGAIVMSAVLLQRKGELEGWPARAVDRIRASAARMGRIIDDLLTYGRTRLGAGLPIERGSADLAEVTRKVVEELRAAHPDAAVEVTASGDVRGEWDGARLEQVVSNLVSNALDHGEEGVPVRVAVDPAGDAVALRVENRGEMPAGTIEHAFEAFHRGPEPAGRKASGLGLGLFIAREIVRRHGGEIVVDSAGGVTAVRVVLPRRAPAGAATAG